MYGSQGYAILGFDKGEKTLGFSALDGRMLCCVLRDTGNTGISDTVQVRTAKVVALSEFVAGVQCGFWGPWLVGEGRLEHSVLAAQSWCQSR